MSFNHDQAETYREEHERRLQLFLLKRAQEKSAVDAPVTRIEMVRRSIRQVWWRLMNPAPQMGGKSLGYMRTPRRVGSQR